MRRDSCYRAGYFIDFVEVAPVNIRLGSHLYFYSSPQITRIWGV